jgi:hypothetical protein
MTGPTVSERTISCTFALKPSQFEHIKSIAEKREISFSRLIRKLIAEEISKEKAA